MGTSGGKIKFINRVVSAANRFPVQVSGSVHSGQEGGQSGLGGFRFLWGLGAGLGSRSACLGLPFRGPGRKHPSFLVDLGEGRGLESYSQSKLRHGLRVLIILSHSILGRTPAFPQHLSLVGVEKAKFGLFPGHLL